MSLPTFETVCPSTNDDKVLYKTIYIIKVLLNEYKVFNHNIYAQECKLIFKHCTALF